MLNSRTFSNRVFGVRQLASSDEKRKEKGYQIPEFAAAISLLVVFVLIPLISLAAIPVRFELTKLLVQETVRKLVLNQKFSTAIDGVKQPELLENAISKVGGIKLISSKVSLLISDQNTPDNYIEITKKGTIPTVWLPDGHHCLNRYFLVLTVTVEINPFFTSLVLGKSVPCLNGPIPASFRETAHWQSLGRDATTGDFFVNE